jgi:hypothetical protein
VEGNLPRVTALGQNYPNPFNPSTTIPITVQRTGHVLVRVYDLRGRLVRTVADEIMAAGRHELTFNGEGLASGAYICRLDGMGYSDTKRMMLVK